VEDAEVVLRRAPLFEGLDEESARALRRQMPDVKLSRSEHLFMEGQEGDRLYVVLDGKIKLTRAAADGRENLISVIGPGEMFGELSLFDPRPRTSSASAVTDATLAALAHDTLRAWLLERPDVSMHMLQALARRLRRANDVVADLVFTDGGFRRPRLAADLGPFGPHPGPRAPPQARPLTDRLPPTCAAWCCRTPEGLPLLVIHACR
jgi:CRP/FNR family transcriptional regulator